MQLQNLGGEMLLLIGKADHPQKVGAFGSRLVLCSSQGDGQARQCQSWGAGAGLNLTHLRLSSAQRGAGGPISLLWGEKSALRTHARQ